MTFHVHPTAKQGGAGSLFALLRRTLFPSPLHAVISLASLYIASILIWNFLDFALFRAVWTGTSREACLNETVGGQAGACWPFIQAKLGQFLYGSFPVEQQWRVDTSYLLALLVIVPLLMPGAPYKGVNTFCLFVVLPVSVFFLLYGGALLPILHASIAWFAISVGGGLILYILLTGALSSARGMNKALAGVVVLTLGATLWALPPVDWLPWLALAKVETKLWGGLMVTMVVAVTGIIGAMPIGILLVLGRRSSMPLIRYCSVAVVEVVRGIPLITILFFAIYVLPLFLQDSPDGMVRVLIGVSVFTGAYVSETLRGGLQSIPKGQYESANALGLNPLLTMTFVIMPQVIRRVIPGLMNNFIGLFKDTTLVSIIGIFDLLGGLRASFSDPNWATPVSVYTGFAFVGLIYFIFCYCMSRYSLFLEKRLNPER